MKFAKLFVDAVIPEQMSPGAAGYDLTAHRIKFKPPKGYAGDFHEYGFGIAVEIPKGFVGLIFPRSSISNKDMALCNAVGVIDSDYRGELTARFKIINTYPRDFIRLYEAGERIAQLVVVPYHSSIPEQVLFSELSQTDRAQGGYGSTNGKETKRAKRARGSKVRKSKAKINKQTSKKRGRAQ